MSEIVKTLNNILENIVDNGIIKEEDPSAKGKLEEVRIIKFDNQKTIIFSPDKPIKIGRKKPIKGCISPLLKAGEQFHHHKACDAVVIKIKSENECEIAYIELKSSYSDKQKESVIKKFKSTKCFAYYLKEILRVLYDIEKVKISKEFYTVFIKQRPLNKKGTFPKNETSTNINNPRKRYVISKKEIWCKSLFK